MDFKNIFDTDPTRKPVTWALLLDDAIERSASHIHLYVSESNPDTSWFAYRINGRIERQTPLPYSLAQPMCALIMADANIDAGQVVKKPQSGHITHERGGSLRDVHVQAAPLVGNATHIVVHLSDPDGLFTASEVTADDVPPRHDQEAFAHITPVEDLSIADATTKCCSLLEHSDVFLLKQYGHPKAVVDAHLTAAAAMLYRIMRYDGATVQEIDAALEQAFDIARSAMASFQRSGTGPLATAIADAVTH